MTGLIILAIIVAIIGYAIFVYNNLVKNRQLVEEGWSGIDVQLKRRTDLIPNLLETVKGYMGHERETLEAVTNARAAATAGAYADAPPIPPRGPRFHEPEQLVDDQGERVSEAAEIVPALRRAIAATEAGQPALVEFITEQETVISRG